MLKNEKLYYFFSKLEQVMVRIRTFIAYAVSFLIGWDYGKLTTPWDWTELGKNKAIGIYFLPD